MNKVKVLLLYIVYPLAMGTYFKRAFQRNENVDLKVCGPYTGSWIPWMGGMNLPEKYAIAPNIPLPFPPNVGRVSYDFVKAQLGNWKPDLVVACDAGLNWIDKPKDGFVATIGTDPHVLDYSHARGISDKFFNMQLWYAEKNDVYLPYAYDPTVHYKTPELPGANLSGIPAYKDTDAVLIGMPYENRVQWVNELRKHGVSVIFENAPVFDEYRALANRARIGLNWSSMNDLNARAFEVPAFGLMPIMNSVPDLHRFKFYEDTLIFSDLKGAVEQVLWAITHPENARQLAESAWQHVKNETYDARVEQLLKECGYV